MSRPPEVEKKVAKTLFNPEKTVANRDRAKELFADAKLLPNLYPPVIGKPDSILTAAQNAYGLMGMSDTRLRNLTSFYPTVLVPILPRFAPGMIVTRDYQLNHLVVTSPEQAERADVQKSAEFAGDTLTKEGARQRALKKLINSAFDRRALEGYMQNLDAIIETEMEKWAKIESKDLPIKTSIFDLVSKIAASTLMGGIEISEKLMKNIVLVTTKGLQIEGLRMAFPVLKLLPVPPGSREYDRVLAETTEEIKNLLKKDMKVADNSIFALLKRAMVEGDSIEGLGGNLTEEEAVREFLGIFAAAFETTATVVMWALAHLSQNEEMYERLREEAMSFEGPFDPHKSSYAQQCFDEAGRLYPPAWRQMRQVVEDCEMKVGERTMRMKKDTLIVTLVHLMHRNPDVWGEDAEMFNPEHTSPENLANVNRLHKGAYVPWTEGIHVCPGKTLSKMEGAKILHAFARRNTFKDLQAMIRIFPKPHYGTALSPVMN